MSPSVNVCRLASPRGLVVSNALGDVAKYLSEAATSIFKPTGGSDVPMGWKRDAFHRLRPGEACVHACSMYAVPIVTVRL